MKNRDGWDVEVALVGKVEISDNGVALTKDDGWTLWVTNEELAGFVPEVGDAMVVYTQGFSQVRGIMIDGHVFRYQTKDEAEAERIQWLADLEASRQKEYEENNEKWQAEVEALHPTLRKRIRRFESEKGAHAFWTDSGPYEMYAMGGANALLKAAEFYHPGDTDRQVKFIDDWWDINSDKHDYNYQWQKELVPDFGEGHSGWTASASKGMARAILTGEYSE